MEVAESVEYPKTITLAVTETAAVVCEGHKLTRPPPCARHGGGLGAHACVRSRTMTGTGNPPSTLVVREVDRSGEVARGEPGASDVKTEATLRMGEPSTWGGSGSAPPLLASAPLLACCVEGGGW